MRTGIFFGGKSREREISFAGGRTVYDLLDKSLFTPVPIFIDSLGNFILLNWQYLYKGSVRDFYPPVSYLPKDKVAYQVYIECLGGLSPEAQDAIINEVGTRVRPDELRNFIDFAFLALHGPYGEDGSIQGILSFYDIPYTGSGILPSAIGIDKGVQKHLMKEMGLLHASSFTVLRDEWEDKPENQKAIFERIDKLPVVIKSASQGSSIGVSILREKNFGRFRDCMNQSLFIREIKKYEFTGLDAEQKHLFIQQLCDIYEGTGAPFLNEENEILYHPSDVAAWLESRFAKGEKLVTLKSLQTESAVLIEEFIEGREFSCIVVEGMEGETIALPPTEIIKSGDIFNYRAKYLPGISRKVTPIDLPEKLVEAIAENCEKLYRKFSFDVYARIDGIIKADGSIYLNDPNTTSGMLPSSFFFHQAAEIGLSPSQFLTYIIYKSIEKRRQKAHKAYKLDGLLNGLEDRLGQNRKAGNLKKNIAVILGGTSTERHISVESGRNVFEKLSSSGKYNAIPVFLTYENDELAYYKLPLNLLLKDNADDIAEKAKDYHIAPIIAKIIEKASGITGKFGIGDYSFYPEKLSLEDIKAQVDEVFIGLHGRPGEDGTLQQMLEKYDLPYNGSGYDSSSITINKYITNEILKDNGFLIPGHVLVKKEEWSANPEEVYAQIEDQLNYPLIAKPADDGCSSAVKKIDNREQLALFTATMFRDIPKLSHEIEEALGLKTNEEFPTKDFFVVEELVKPEGADHFIEVTGGMLTTFDAAGNLRYEVFEPSEALASKGILSLEEKFLAGEGQNITPARFSRAPENNKRVSAIVRDTLERAARILRIEGYCRIDAFVRIFGSGKVEVIFIEVNSLPGLTPATCIFHQAALNGYKPFEFLDQIIDYGESRQRNRHQNV